MTTQLTTPISTSITTVTLDGWELVVKRNQDLTVDLADSNFRAELAFRNGGGVTKYVTRFTRTGPQLPVSVRNAIRDLQLALITYIRAQGVLPAGTDTQDF